MTWTDKLANLEVDVWDGLNERTWSWAATDLVPVWDELVAVIRALDAEGDYDVMQALEALWVKVQAL